MAADAIIFIPGIKGTTLVQTNRTPFDTLWSGVQSNFETIEDLALSRSSTGAYYDTREQTIVSTGQIEPIAYGEFLRDLETDLPVFIFHYDWRQSATVNGERLHAFMSYLCEKSGATKDEAYEKFHFVTHSLGSLIVRAYLAKHGTKKVDRMVFTVPPFLGALGIAAACLLGEGWFDGVKSKMRRLMRGMPGPLELLPNYADASRFQDDGSAHSFFDYGHWQSNVKRDKGHATQLREALGDAASTIGGGLFDLAQLSPAAKKKTLVIARDGMETLQSVNVLREGVGGLRNQVDFDHAVTSENGDGRVPHVSSCCYAAHGVPTVMVTHSWWRRDPGHGLVLDDERVQDLVGRFLRGRFKHEITGGSVKQVTALRQVQVDGDLWDWEPIYADT